jgi:hypothetical protein
MSALPEYPRDPEALIKLDRAHKALDAAVLSMQADIDKTLQEVELRHNPFIWTAQSVLYEALANASLCGFTREETEEIMDCDRH